LDRKRFFAYKIDTIYLCDPLICTIFPFKLFRCPVLSIYAALLSVIFHPAVSIATISCLELASREQGKDSINASHSVGERESRRRQLTVKRRALPCLPDQHSWHCRWEAQEVTCDCDRLTVILWGALVLRVWWNGWLNRQPPKSTEVYIATRAYFFIYVHFAVKTPYT